MFRTAGTMALVDALSVNSTLTSLDLYGMWSLLGCSMANEHMMFMAKALEFSKKERPLWLLFCGGIRKLHRSIWMVWRAVFGARVFVCQFSLPCYK